MKGDKSHDAGLPPLPCAGRYLLFYHQSIRTPSRLVGAAYRTVAGGSEVHASRSTVPYRCLGRASRSHALVITLPPGDHDFSNHIKAMKIRFVQALPPTEGRSLIRMAKGERGIWQRRSWEYATGDEGDYAHHMEYAHFHPVKHGYVSVVAHWPHSTFHRRVKTGAYPRDWGGAGALDVATGERSR